ncbi:MAG: D-2-hydroxyacid dehydrogenase [Hyphomicrobiales bacterium]
MKILVTGAAGFEDLPDGARAPEGHEFIFSNDDESLQRHLPDAEIILGWNFRGNGLADYWHLARSLKWVQWCGAGVDGVLFPDLVDSDVVLTNARGLYDRAMAEYALCFILMQLKDMPRTLSFQTKRDWQYRLTGKLVDKQVAIYGVGSIGASIASMLKAVGMNVTGIGRTAREDHPEFGKVYDQATAKVILSQADWVIGILPATPETELYFDADFFGTMKPAARFINLGRGVSVDEVALLDALKNKKIAGAALDVFQNEPLPQDDPLWVAPNLIISPHMSGDDDEANATMFELFCDNLKRYENNEPLRNLVDKQRGYAAR